MTDMSEETADIGSWNRVASMKDLPVGESIEVTCGNHIVALFNDQGTIYALDGVCPHQGGPLGKGVLEERVVTCPWHGWRFDVSNGQCNLSAAIVQPKFETKVEDADIFVWLPT